MVCNGLALCVLLDHNCVIESSDARSIYDIIAAMEMPEFHEIYQIVSN